jgi:hypothetical protein
VVRRRFGGADSPGVAQLARQIRAARPDDLLGFPESEAAALMRLALDEAGLAEGLAGGDLNYPEVMITVLGTILADWRPGPEEVSGLLGEVKDAAQWLRELDPDVAQAEALWSEVGMDSSSLAYPMSPDSVVTASSGSYPLDGVIAPGQNQLAAAVMAYSGVLERDPGAAWALAGRGYVSELLGWDEEALADYGRECLLQAVVFIQLRLPHSKASRLLTAADTGLHGLDVFSVSRVIRARPQGAQVDPGTERLADTARLIGLSYMTIEIPGPFLNQNVEASLTRVNRAADLAQVLQVYMPLPEVVWHRLGAIGAVTQCPYDVEADKHPHRQRLSS